MSSYYDTVIEAEGMYSLIIVYMYVRHVCTIALAENIMSSDIMMTDL